MRAYFTYDCGNSLHVWCYKCWVEGHIKSGGRIPTGNEVDNHDDESSQHDNPVQYPPETAQGTIRVEQETVHNDLECEGGQ